MEQRNGYRQVQIRNVSPFTNNANSNNLPTTSNTKFHYKKGRFHYYCFKPYYPVRFNVNEVELKARKLVYNFKDGIRPAQSVVAEMVSTFLNEKFDSFENMVFMVIPASTAYKTQIRFQSFCQIVSRRVGIANGCGGITVEVDREELKGNCGANKIANLSFDLHFIVGKHIVLFDDVITSGKSFQQTAEKLLELGAEEVIGLFLAKTVWKDN